MFRSLAAFPALTALFLSGCAWHAGTEGPDPGITVSPGLYPDRAARAWWREIGGPSLDDLVREALTHSPTVDVLAARLEVARAEAASLRAAGQPVIGAEAQRREGRRQEFETGGEAADVMPYAGGVNASWEIDFWGRVRALRRAAAHSLQAARAEESAGRLLLIAELAGFDLHRRRLAAEEAIMASVWEANQSTVGRLRELERAGIIGTVVLQRQVGEGEKLRREIEETGRQRQVTEAALDRLLGRDPGAKPWPAAPSFAPFPDLPDALPVEQLARRPDIQAAAARVASAWDLSRAATLDLLPKLKFVGLLEGRTVRLTPSIEEWVAMIAPTLEIPLWDADRLAAASKNRAEARLAAAEYRQTILESLEETENALTNLQAQERILTHAKSEARLLDDVLNRTREQFVSGLVSQLEVLEDQRAALQARRAVLEAEAGRRQAWIDLHKAIGG